MAPLLVFEDQNGQERILNKGVEYIVDYRCKFVCWDSAGGAHMNLLLMWLEIHSPLASGLCTRVHRKRQKFNFGIFL